MNISKIEKYPITPFLEEICNSLKNSSSRFLILTAETAAGKSTVLPLGLLENFSGKILMTEPRRLATLSVANRVSELFGEECGKTIGYNVHLEKKISKQTRLEVVTEAILIRKIQEDPFLEDISVVVLDEFHERSVYTDLSLAFLKEAVEARNDLFVIVMSATIDVEKIQGYLSAKTTVLKIPGRQFPVKVIYDGKSSVEEAVIREIRETNEKKGILVFLPGISDIRKCEKNLKEYFENLPCSKNEKPDIFVLHSSISLLEQKNIISEETNDSEIKNTKSKIIISSSIAETSLTVPGITCVIDSGLARINRFDVSTGMEKLVTETESEFSAEQRKGRAGRICEGRCIRLWSENDKRISEMPPEILRTDLSTVILECAARGISSCDGISWLDKPLSSAWNSSCELLKLLGLLDSNFAITKKGQFILGLGVNPRLGCIAYEGCLDFDNKKSRLLEAEKIILKYGNYASSSVDVQKKFLCDLENRIGKKHEEFGNELCEFDEEKEKFPVVLSGFPDRIAKRCGDENEVCEYQFFNGRKAVLKGKPDCKKKGDWVVAPEVMAGDRQGTIFNYEEISDDVAERWCTKYSEKKIECSFENGKISKNEVVCYGRIILCKKKLPVEKGDLASAWISEVYKKGFSCLPLNEKTKAFLLRAEFYYQQQEKTFQEEIKKLNCEIISKGFAESICVKKINEWLPAFLGSNEKLTENMVYDGIYWILDGKKIDTFVPMEIILENGRKCKVKYELQSSNENKNVIIIRPVIEIIIQRIFGCYKSPEICGVKVLLKLLSPASRPLQITDDLEHFWVKTWPEICKEMKGRYPKHNWNYQIVDKN